MFLQRQILEDVQVHHFSDIRRAYADGQLTISGPSATIASPKAGLIDKQTIGALIEVWWGQQPGRP